MTDRRLTTGILGMLGTSALIGVLAACGGAVSGSATGAEVARSIESIGSKIAQAAPTTRPGSATADGTTGTSQQPPLTVTVGRTGWYDGFAMTVQEVTATESFGGATVEMALIYENIGRSVGYAPRGSVEVDGAVGDTFDDLPQDEIPAGATGKGTITVAVPASAEGSDDLQRAVDAVTLVYGEKGDNRTLIPLAEREPVVSIEPRHLDVGGSLAQSSVTVDLVSGEFAPSWESGDEGRLVIDLQVKVSCADGCRDSGYYSDRDYFTLTDGAGVTLAADQLRSGYCCEAIYPGTVVQGEGSTLSFVVDEPGTGSYTLTYEDPSVTAEGFPAGSLAFTV